jgi:hypothetical protein
VLVRRHRTLERQRRAGAGRTTGCLVTTTPGQRARGARTCWPAVRGTVTALPLRRRTTPRALLGPTASGTRTFAGRARRLRDLGSRALLAGATWSNARRGAADRDGDLALRAWPAKTRWADSVGGGRDRAPPNRTFSGGVTVGLGGREVALHHPGEGTPTTTWSRTTSGRRRHVRGGRPRGAGARQPSFDDAFSPRVARHASRPACRGWVRWWCPGPPATSSTGSSSRPQLTDIAELADAATRLPPDADDEALERVASRLAVGWARPGSVGLRRRAPRPAWARRRAP